MIPRLLFIVIMLFCFLQGCGRQAGPISPYSRPQYLEVGAGDGYKLKIKIESPRLIYEDNRSVLSFLSDTQISVSGSCSKEQLCSKFQWWVEGFNATCDQARISRGVGGEYRFYPYSTNMTVFLPRDPLRYKIHSNLDESDSNNEDALDLTIEQDNLDTLRQEYIDVHAARNTPTNRRVIPSRDSFDQHQPRVVRLLQGDKCAGHEWHIVRELDERVNTIVDWLTRTGYASFSVTCGYRCPVRNAQTRGSASASEHMEGFAFDWDCGGNNVQNSKIIHQIYALIAREYQTSTIILYDEERNQYFWPASPGLNPIPENYDDVPENVIFTQGHTDWRRGW